jgi:hypothetical protein
MGRFAPWIAAHRKAIAGAVGFAGAVLTFLAAQQTLGDVAKYAGIVLAVLGAAGVYRVPNAHPVVTAVPVAPVPPQPHP